MIDTGSVDGGVPGTENGNTGLEDQSIENLDDQSEQLGVDPTEIEGTDDSFETESIDNTDEIVDEYKTN